MLHPITNIYICLKSPLLIGIGHSLLKTLIGGEELDILIGKECNLKRSDFDSTRRIVFVKDKKFVYDYVYKWSKIEFLPLGITIDRDDCKFTVEEAGTDKIILKHATER